MRRHIRGGALCLIIFCSFLYGWTEGVHLSLRLSDLAGFDTLTACEVLGWSPAHWDRMWGEASSRSWTFFQNVGKRWSCRIHITFLPGMQNVACASSSFCRLMRCSLIAASFGKTSTWKGSPVREYPNSEGPWSGSSYQLWLSSSSWYNKVDDYQSGFVLNSD